MLDTVLLWSFLVNWISVTLAESPHPPRNVSVLSVYRDGAVLAWAVHGADVRGVELSVARADTPPRGSSLKRFIIQVDASESSHTVSDLMAETQYHVTCRSYTTDATYSNATHTLTFTTEGDGGTDIGGLVVRPFEVGVIASLITAWGTAVVQFVHRWNDVNISKATNSRVQPKNLHSVKVVKNATDSIIHRTYTKSMRTMMAARQERIIARLNTMPEINAQPSMKDTLHKTKSMGDIQAYAQNQAQNQFGQVAGQIGQVTGQVGQMAGQVGQVTGQVGQVRGKVGQVTGKVRQVENHCVQVQDQTKQGQVGNQVVGQVGNQVVQIKDHALEVNNQSSKDSRAKNKSGQTQNIDGQSQMNAPVTYHSADFTKQTQTSPGQVADSDGQVQKDSYGTTFPPQKKKSKHNDLSGSKQTLMIVEEEIASSDILLLENCDTNPLDM